MSLLEIKYFPDPILKQRAQEVAPETIASDAKLHKLLDDMWETMYAAEGIGLAAPQVGVSQRVAVVQIGEEETPKFELINPRIIAKAGSSRSEEGCLSIPEFRESIARAEHVTVKAFDRTGTEYELKGEALLSYCLQHEIDHLDGVLFVDRLSQLKKQLFKRWLTKQINEENE